jgi:hypothetical protein
MKKKKKDPRGRKKISDPKKHINLYVETSKVEKIGGYEQTQSFCYEQIDKKTSDEN